MERELTIEVGEEVYEDLEKRAELIKEGREIQEEIEELQKKQNKLAMQAQKLEEKVSDPVEDIVNEETDIGEFEYLATVRMEDGDVVVLIVDKLEEIKEQLREQEEEEE